MMEKHDKICVGIVTYNPDLRRLSKVLDSISCQVVEVIIVDNGSNNSDDLINLIKEYNNVGCLLNEENKGIAKALNQICYFAYERSYDWALTLDQDTVCPKDLVQKLSMYSDKDEVGIVCPAVYYEGVNVDAVKPQFDTEYVYACMTSASLTRIEAWRSVGGFDETYFIDFVDNEFCMKLKLQGYRILRTHSCHINHQLGNTNIISLFGIKLKGTHHNNTRSYYMMSNNVLFIKRYSDKLSIPKECAKLLKTAWNEFLFSPKRMDTLKSLVCGVKDGIKGKSGNILCYEKK